MCCVLCAPKRWSKHYLKSIKKVENVLEEVSWPAFRCAQHPKASENTHNMIWQMLFIFRSCVQIVFKNIRNSSSHSTSNDDIAGNGCHFKNQTFNNCMYALLQFGYGQVQYSDFGDNCVIGFKMYFV